MAQLTHEPINKVFYKKNLVRIKLLEEKWKDSPDFILKEGLLTNYDRMKDFEVLVDDVWLLSKNWVELG
jgi:hypothetical protein